MLQDAPQPGAAQRSCSSPAGPTIPPRAAARLRHRLDSESRYLRNVDRSFPWPGGRQSAPAALVALAQPLLQHRILISSVTGGQMQSAKELFIHELTDMLDAEG